MAAASATSLSAAVDSTLKDASRQKPLTYLRQVTALLLDPGLLASGGYGRYPADAVAKARSILGGFAGSSVGSYTHTGGQLPVREACARFLTRRDGGGLASARVEDVHVTCGSTEAIRLLLEGFGRRKPLPAGVLVPAPGCPMYADFAREVGVLPTAYRLGGPEAGWQLVEEELEAAYESAVASGSEPRILVLINPGSPAGQILTEASLRLAADFAHRRRLFVIADETLQFVVHGEANFVGFRRVVLESPSSPPLEAASLASLSRGPTSGEPGLRVGFCELLNLHPAATAGLLAVLACTSCPPVIGQAALRAALEPPVPGEESHEIYAAEVSHARSVRYHRAALVARFFAANPDCGDLPEPPAAGDFAYARIRLPADADAAAAVVADEPVDATFCRELAQLDGFRGADVRPGSEFGHGPLADGTAFFVRIGTQLAEEDLLANLERIRGFRLDFLARHRCGGQ